MYRSEFRWQRSFSQLRQKQQRHLHIKNYTKQQRKQGIMISRLSIAPLWRLHGHSKILATNRVRFLSSDTGSPAVAAASATGTNNSNLPPEEPTARQLRILALRSAIPMVGFGFMDNIVMIQAGEAIDMSIGVSFGLSTLTAAGFGQCVSDVAGFTCGGLVDAAVAKMNLPQHNLTPAQLDLKSSRAWHTLGGCVGVVTGCLLGMSCLLFKDTDRAERAKKAKELQSIFESILDEGHNLINAERATLWILDQDKKREQKTVWSRVASGVNGVIEAPLEGSIIGDCIRTGKTINIRDAYKDERFNPKVDQKTGYHTTSVLAVPFRDRDGNILGAIQMINRKDDKTGQPAAFGEGDERCVKMLGSHVACFIRIVNSD